MPGPTFVSPRKAIAPFRASASDMDPSPSQMAGSIIVINESCGPMHVFVSKYSNKNGGDAWYTIEAGERDSWSRPGWEVVAFKDANDTHRAGVYVPTNSTVTYRGLNDITWR
ncbi:hypothetical protein OH77DRAFT_1520632 [Trametes cingulata]|nr:hypothetical protein OH77DRAFT_1520632 [Trametes cingulata]